MKSLKKIAYIPSVNFSYNRTYDTRNLFYYSKINNLTIHKFNKKKDYDYLVLPPNFDVSDIEWLKKRKEKIIYQLVDNYLSENIISFKNLFRGVYKYLIGEYKNLIFNYKKNLIELCKLSYCVICSSEIQKKKIYKYNKNTKIFFESHFDLIKNVKKNYTIKKKIKIVWEGRCENLNSLKIIVKPLQLLLKKFSNIEIHIISDYESYNPRFPIIKKNSIKIIKRIFGKLFSTNTTFFESKIFFHQWNKILTPKIICECDIAIIPLIKENGFHYGKSYNKLLMFQKYKIPTITTKIPSYFNLEKKIGINFTCTSTNEWVKKIEKIIYSDKYKLQLVNKSYSYLKKNYSKKKFTAQWRELFI
jgi:hypothetical protein